MKRLLGGAGAALGVKVATGFAVAAMAATAAVAATEVAITGSVDPSHWGQQVTQQVAACKASAARLDVHGIGQCVSQFANQHGKAVSDAHKASAARENGHGNANGHGNGNSSANGNGNGNKGNDDKSEKTRSPAPGRSLDREPTDPPIVTHIWLPPPPP